MTGSSRWPIAAVAALSLAAAAGTPQNPPPVMARLAGINARLAQYHIQRAQGRPAGTLAKVRFELSEAEVNQYLDWSLRVTPRPGLESMHLKFFPRNYISTYAVLDFDAVERWRPGTVPLVLRPVLNGRRAIWVDIRFQAADHAATYKVEKAYFDKIPIPARVMEKVIAVVASRQPEHYDTTRPIPLPQGLNTAWTRSQALGAETRGR